LMAYPSVIRAFTIPIVVRRFRITLLIGFRLIFPHRSLVIERHDQ